MSGRKRPRHTIVGLLIVGVIPRWALLAPVFMKLGVAPEAVLAAYRVGDSPPNVITLLMPISR